MNHKNAMPAQGTRLSAMAMVARRDESVSYYASRSGIGRRRDGDENEGQAEQQRESDSRNGRGSGPTRGERRLVPVIGSW